MSWQQRLVSRPVHPVIFNGLVDILMKDFGADVDLAITLAQRMIASLRMRDLDIIRGNWMEDDTILQKNRRETWETLAADAEEWANGPTSPFNRPELQ